MRVACVAEVARSPCVEAGLVRPLLVLLKDDRSVQCQIQAGRALGNICYENGQYTLYIISLMSHLGANSSRISIDIIIYFMFVGSNHISCQHASGRALARIQKLPVQNVHFSKCCQSSSYLSHYKTKQFHQSWPTSASLQDWETGL